MECPLCSYVMDPFDKECRRCHGKGIAKTTPPPVVEAVPVLRSAPPPAPKEAVTARVGLNLPYFFAAHESLLGKNSIYRVYVDSDALFFLEAGIFHPGMTDAIKRMYGENENGLSASGAMVSNLARAGAVQGGLAGGAAGMAVGGLMMGLGALYDAQNAKRTDALDQMTPELLRAEAQTGKTGFCATALDTSQVVLRPSKKMSLTDSPQVAGYMNLAHQTGGKPKTWKFTLLTLTDSRFAAQEMRRIFGVERINLQFAF